MPATTEQVQALLSDGRVGVRVELWQNGQKVATPAVEAWSVEVATGAARSLTLTLAAFDDLLPVEVISGTNGTYGDGTYGGGIYGNVRRRSLAGLVQIVSTQVKVWYRRFDRLGVVHEFPAGVFDVSAEDFTLGEADEETVTVTAYDARRSIAKAGWVDRYKAGTGVDVWTHCCNIATTARPGLTCDTAADLGVTKKLGARRFYGLGKDMDPWQAIEDLAKRAGLRPFINAEGRLTAAKLPDLGSNPPADWVFREGDGGTIVTAGTGHDDEEMANTVIAVGSSTKKGLIYAIAVNDRPGDPYAVSKIGRRAVTISASGCENSGEAQALADAELRRRLGVAETYTVDALVLPFLEEYDVVKVVSDQLDASDLALLDGYSITGAQDPVTTYNATRRLS